MLRNPFRIGFSSYIFGTSDWLHSVKYAIDHKYDFIELMHEFPQDTLSPSMIERILSLKKAYGLDMVVHAPVVEVDLGNIRENIRKAAVDAIKGSVRVAEILGSDLLVTHCGYKPFSSKKSAFTQEQKIIQSMAWKRCSETLHKSLAQIASFGDDCGVRIGIENTDSPHSYIYSAEDFNRYEDIPNIYSVFDVGHANCKGKPYEYAEKVNGKLVEVHFSDNDGKLDTHSPLGKGNIDFRRIFDGLKGFSGNMLLDLQAGYGNELERSRKCLEDCYD